MNQQVIDYLKQNKDNYVKESLITQLKNAGHVDSDIQEAVTIVYGVESTSHVVPAPRAENANNMNPINVSAQKSNGSNTIVKIFIFVGIALFILFVIIVVGIYFLVKMSQKDMPDNGVPYAGFEEQSVMENKTPVAQQQEEELLFNGEKYLLAFHEETPEKVISEYTAGGEDVYNWTTLITILDYPAGADAKMQLDGLVNLVKSEYAEANDGNDIIIKEGGSDIYMAQFALPSEDYIEYNIIKYVNKTDGGVRSYQFAMKFYSVPSQEDFDQLRASMIPEMRSFVITK